MATIKNYFSTKIPVSQIRAHVGASPILTIQRLDGLSVVDLPISKMPAQGDASFVSTKNQITMNVDAGNNYTGSISIQDPNVAAVGVSIPPTGTIGYFAREDIPDGWLEIGNPVEYFLFERQVGGTWLNPVYANTEFTEIFNVLNDWGLIRSTSRTVQGRAFNTQDPFKGYFIRCLNPSATGVDPGHTIFDTEQSYISIHKHEGETLYQFSGKDSPFVGGAIDRGNRMQVNESFGKFGADVWFNYKWKVTFNWDVENDGTVLLTHASNGLTSPAKYMINYDEHIHGQIKTYYRGIDGLYGKITTHRIEEPTVITRDVADAGKDSTVKLTGSLTMDTDVDQEHTFYNPYRTAGLPLITVYTQISAYYTRSFYSLNTESSTAYQTVKYSYTDQQRDEVDYTSVLGKQFIDITQGRTDLTQSASQRFTGESKGTSRDTFRGSELTYSDEFERNTLKGVLGEYHKRIRIDYRYYPYHILKSNAGTPSGSEFYNSGDYGLYSGITSSSGNHDHDYAILSGGNPVVRGRGQGHENRPTNIALKMCIKY